MCRKSGRFYFYASYTGLFIMLTFDDIIWVMSPLFLHNPLCFFTCRRRKALVGCQSQFQLTQARVHIPGHRITSGGLYTAFSPGSGQGSLFTLPRPDPPPCMLLQRNIPENSEVLLLLPALLSHNCHPASGYALSRCPGA